MLAWILEAAGLNPGFLIGGVPLDFKVSARNGGDIFVVEADEYDTAFFDKRAKFVHYLPHIAILNNLEYDHADIYPDVSAIRTQFHHLVRTIPGRGIIIANGQDSQLDRVIEQGCWSRLQQFSFEPGHEWQVVQTKPDGTELAFYSNDALIGEMTWNHSGRHNAMNAMAAVAASVAAGVDVTTALNALSTFGGVKRRMEKLAEISGIHVYDDFAHHPTAIRLTLEGLRKRVGNDRILVALEPRSNTMRAGVHADELGPALIAADSVWLRAGAGIDWDPNVALAPLDGRGKMVVRTADMLEQLLDQAKPGDHVVFMSNGGFESAQHRFCTALNQRARD